MGNPAKKLIRERSKSGHRRTGSMPTLILDHRNKRINQP
jgi:hypothetical protein